MKDAVAIIDVGSESLVTLIGEHGANNTFNVCGKGDIYYAGFQDAEFLEPESLKFAIANSISNAEQNADRKIYEIFVGVPGEFCTCVTKTINLNFPKLKKITQFDIQNIFDTGNDFAGDPMYAVINKSVIYYDLDGAKRVINPLGMKAKNVTGYVSYILARKSFLGVFKSIFAELKIMVKGFISSNLAENLYLFDPKTRDKYALLVDVGYITTNVTLARGNGILFMNSFSLGGGYITSDLSECLKISFGEAERLKHKIVLGWKPGKSDTYEIDGNSGNIQTYDAAISNDIVSARIEMICDYINKCIDNCIYDLPDFVPLYLTGGGFNYIRGVKTVLNSKFNRKINLVGPDYPNITGPDYSSEVGILNLILNYGYMLEGLLNV